MPDQMNTDSTRYMATASSGKEGLVMPNDGQIFPWRLLAPALRKFPAGVLPNSMINVTCCFGAHGIKITDDLMELVFGILGPKVEITFGQGWAMTKKFYMRMIRGESINEIVPAINREIGKTLLFALPTLAYRTLVSSRSGMSPR